MVSRISSRLLRRYAPRNDNLLRLRDLGVSVVKFEIMRPPYARTLFGLLREQAERYPDRTAVICGERAATYRDLADGAGRIGAALRAHGIGRGDRVGILVNNRLEWLEACFRRDRTRRGRGAVQHLVEAG